MAKTVRQTTTYDGHEFEIGAVAVEVTSVQRTPQQWKAFAEVAVTIEVDGKKLVLEGDVLLRRFHKSPVKGATSWQQRNGRSTW